MTPEQHTNRGKWEKIHMIQTPSEKYTASPPLYAKKIAKFCEEKLRVHHTCRLPRPRGIIPVQAQQQHQMLNPFCRQQDLFPPILDSPPVFFLLPPSQEKNSSQSRNARTRQITEEISSMDSFSPKLVGIHEKE